MHACVVQQLRYTRSFVPSLTTTCAKSSSTFLSVASTKLRGGNLATAAWDHSSRLKTVARKLALPFLFLVIVPSLNIIWQWRQDFSNPSVGSLRTATFQEVQPLLSNLASIPVNHPVPPRLVGSARPTSHRVSTAMAPTTAALTALRPITKVVQGQKAMEGAGVRICRTVGTTALRNLDPFLMLDEMKIPARQAAAGFPDHPHRGFETVSIMINGEMEHRDSYGNHGIIKSGGVQWMTAGRGLVHSEMPKVTEGTLWGFQLWVNLPAKDKMIKPRYQDYQAESIPVVEKDGVTVRVLAGESYGKTGPVEMRNPGMLLDVQLAQGAQFEQAVSAEWNGFVYISDGAGKVCGTTAKHEQALVMGPGDHLVASTDQPSGMRFLLVAGRPIGEPIVQYGPFVMNTQEQIEQAFTDYQTGKLQDPNDNVWDSWKQ